MWIFLTDAFLSIVDKDGDGTTLLVRARRAGDIERVFPGAEVIEGASSDCRCRARTDGAACLGFGRTPDHPNGFGNTNDRIATAAISMKGRA